MSSAPLSGLSLFLLDDEPMLRRQLTATLERLGADVTAAESLRAARPLIREMGFDFALLDLNLPDGLGLELLRERAFSESTGVVMMTAEGGIPAAVEAMKLGALDFLTKPFEPEMLALVLSRARKSRQGARAAEHRKADSSEQNFFFGRALLPLEGQLKKIVSADQRMGSQLPPVLIQGETGTGKTTLARWIHSHGPRAGGPLVEANCAAIPDNLAESELFGHEKGAFTDARSTRLGLFEAASGGTLFLDEITSLTPALQAKLLTAIEDGKIRRVGGNRDIPVDTRLITAANRDLREMVSAKLFREDLYHRLDLFRIAIPPLRERGDDVLALAESLLGRLARRHHVPARTFSAIGRRRLTSYAWPGNVRELSHELQRALVFEEGDTLNLDTLMGAVGSDTASIGASTAPSASGPTAGETDPQEAWFNASYRFPDSGFSLEEAILRLIRHALNQTGGNVSAAARKLGVSRDYLRYRLGGWKDGEKPPAATPAGE